MAGVAGRSGRRPKPTKNKELSGNPGKRKLNGNEPDYDLATHVEPPEWIFGEALEVWNLLVPQLLKSGVLRGTDLHNVECFCTAYGNWRAAQRDVNLHGILVPDPNGVLRKNPALTAAKEAMSQIVTFGALLGLDPSSRTRLMGEGKKGGSNPFSDLIP